MKVYETAGMLTLRFTTESGGKDAHVTLATDTSEFQEDHDGR